MSNKFTWGDEVFILETAPSCFHPGASASICGFVQIESKATSAKFQCDIGDWLYILEFEDGSSIQIAEKYLKKNCRF